MPKKSGADGQRKMVKKPDMKEWAKRHMASWLAHYGNRVTPDAITMSATEFVTQDSRQAALGVIAGLKVLIP